MEKVSLGMVGCGGMGTRHLYGLMELYRDPHCNVELVAMCDLVERNAQMLAAEAEKLLGRRPEPYTSLEEMAKKVKGLDALDIVTDSGSHHTVACAALELGKHILVEKPLALTIRGCNAIIRAAERSGKMVAVAENYRRDPINRLVKALLEAGVIGEPYLMVENSAGAGNRVIILPWRHYKMKGGISFDQGVHHADVMQYYLGPVEEAMGYIHLFERTRYWSDEPTGVSPFYLKWRPEIPDKIEADAEDTSLGLLKFRSGALGQWTMFHAAHGQGFRRRSVYGSKGSLDSAGERNGKPPTLCLDGQATVSDGRLLEYVPSFALDEITASLYGAPRLWQYPFTFPETDRKLIAIEYYDFARALLTGSRPEVDAVEGRSALAVVYAIFESGVLGRPVKVEEVEAEEARTYQEEIDQALGLG